MEYKDYYCDNKGISTFKKPKQIVFTLQNHSKIPVSVTRIQHDNSPLWVAVIQRKRPIATGIPVLVILAFSDPCRTPSLFSEYHRCLQDRIWKVAAGSRGSMDQKIIRYKWSPFCMLVGYINGRKCHQKYQQSWKLILISGELKQWNNLVDSSPGI